MKRFSFLLFLIFNFSLSQELPRDGEGIETRYEGVKYKIFSAKPEKIRLFWRNEEGKNYGSLSAVARELRKKGETPLMLSNAAIFTKDEQPAGLWIEKGEKLREANTQKAKGNFHIRPAGVFWVKGKKAGIISLDNWLKKPFSVDYAFQAAPYLLINGQINSRFIKKIFSPYSRNAVCTTKGGKVLFVITNGTIDEVNLPNFYQFAQALKSFNCHQALYLDGNISQMKFPKYGESLFHWKNFAGIIAVLE